MCSNKYYLGDKTTVQSNSHLIFTLQFKIWSKWGTPMRLCQGLTCLNNVFMFHHKLLPSALLPHGIAPKWNKLIGYHSSSFPLWYYCDCRGLHLNVRNDPSSNVLLRHLPLFCCCSGVTLTSKYVLKLTVWAHWYFQFQWGEKLSPPLPRCHSDLSNRSSIDAVFLYLWIRAYIQVKLLVDQTNSNQLFWNRKLRFSYFRVDRLRV